MSDYGLYGLYGLSVVVVCRKNVGIRHARRETGIRIDAFMSDIVIDTIDTCIGSAQMNSGENFCRPNYSRLGSSSPC